MAYVYRHIRLDKNEPFYIGIGDKNKYRINDKRKRNAIWNKIVNKTKYKAEVVLDELTWEEACEKEKEFILMYGRIDEKTGCLSNMTDGGEGTIGRRYTPTLQHRKNLSKASLGKKMSEEAREKMAKSNKLPVIQYELDGTFIKEWDGMIDAAKYLNRCSTGIMRCCQEKFKQAYGFIWKYKYPEKMGKKPRKINELKALINA